MGLCSGRIPLCPTHPFILSKRSWEETEKNWPTDQFHRRAVQGGVNGLIGKRNILISDDSCTGEDHPGNRETLSLLKMISRVLP